MIHRFAGNPLDRADALRRNPEALAAAITHPQGRHLLLNRLHVPVLGDETLSLCWLGAEVTPALKALPPPVLLGLAEGAPHLAWDVSDLEDPDALLPAAARFEEARAAAMVLDGAATGIVAQARAQVDWHRRHGFCSVCGAATEPARGGYVRVCGSCGAQHFPRTDPVAIMLIIDGSRCLLGQSAGRLARTGMFSALAGFIDQGESIEEAVRREVKEEAGIEVGEVSYHSSQPWPFPSSLMIGCHGRAESLDIHMDEEEMAAVAWFERDEVAAAMAGEHPTLKVPGPIAIAHHLLRAWLDGETGLA